MAKGWHDVLYLVRVYFVNKDLISVKFHAQMVTGVMSDAGIYKFQTQTVTGVMSEAAKHAVFSYSGTVLHM